MKGISWGKVAVNTLLLTAIMTSCNVIRNDIDNTSKKVETIQAGATVEERHFDSVKVKEYAVPYGNTAFKSYMGYTCITNKNSKQYKLQSDCWTDENGLRRYGDNDYVIALGSYYADYVGQRFEITLATGEKFTAVVGDFKADCHTDNSHKYTAMSDGRKNVVEFVVDIKKLNSKAKKMGDISYIKGFAGNIDSIESVEE